MTKKFTLIYNIIIDIEEVRYIYKNLDSNDISIYTENDDIITIALDSKVRQEEIFFEIFTELKNYSR